VAFNKHHFASDIQVKNKIINKFRRVVMTFLRSSHKCITSDTIKQENLPNIFLSFIFRNNCSVSSEGFIIGLLFSVLKSYEKFLTE